MTEGDARYDTEDAPEAKDDSPVSPKPQVTPTANVVPAGGTTGQSAAELHRFEAQLIQVLRREVRDPYAGLPADDVLARLDDRFPSHDFPGRMLARVEAEQAARHAHVERIDAVDRFVAEAQSRAADEDRDLQRSVGKRAERVLYVLVGVAVLLIAAGHETPGLIILGTTVVGVVGSFLSQTLGGKK